MKKFIWRYILCILTVTIIVVLFLILVLIKTRTSVDESKIIEKYAIEGVHLPFDGVIPDCDTAIAVAMPVWTSLYGEENLAFNASYEGVYDKQMGVWHIYGILREGYMGGVPHILIQKHDGKVIAVWHTR